MLSLEEIGIITGICSALSAGGYFLSNKIQQKRLRIRRKVIGKWVNAGEASFGSDSHNLELDLEVDLDDGEIRGIVKSICIESESQSPLCSLVGKIRYNSSKIQIFHSRHGEGILYGEAKISFSKKVIVWKLKKGTGDIFPKTTVLYRQPKIIGEY